MNDLNLIALAAIRKKNEIFDKAAKMILPPDVSTNEAALEFVNLHGIHIEGVYSIPTNDRSIVLPADLLPSSPEFFEFIENSGLRLEHEDDKVKIIQPGIKMAPIGLSPFDH